MKTNISQLKNHIYKQEVSPEEHQNLRRFFDAIGIDAYTTLEIFAALAISRLGRGVAEACLQEIAFENQAKIIRKEILLIREFLQKYPSQVEEILSKT